MTVTTGWNIPANPQQGDVWQRNSGISFTWDSGLEMWLPTNPADAFAALLITGGATNQHLAKNGTQAYNLKWVDASDGVLFAHQQASASDEWVVNHSLRQRFVSVSVIPAIDTIWFAPEGTVITPDIDFRTINSCWLRFTRPLQGTALIRR